MNVREISLRNTIPLVINSYNQLYYVKNFIDTFRKNGFNNIYVIDNCSTYPPLLDYYNQLQEQRIATIFFYERNLGPHYFFVKKLYRLLFEGCPFLYSDPDLHYTVIAENFLSRLFDISRHFGVFKVGSALTLPDQSQIKKPEHRFTIEGVTYSLLEWESRFWKETVDKDVYQAEIDTTLHLFNTEFYDEKIHSLDLITGLRVAGAGFEAVHLPWFLWDPCPLEELEYYQRGARFSNWT